MTPHEALTDEIRDQACLFNLGLLEPGEARGFESHLEDEVRATK